MVGHLLFQIEVLQKNSVVLTVFICVSGVNLPRGSTTLTSSYLPSARKVSWFLHHDDTFPLGDVDSSQGALGSDPTCPLELRSTGCNNCNDGACNPKPCEFNQPCPKTDDRATAAKLGGNGALVSHMVRQRRCFSVTLFCR